MGARSGLQHLGRLVRSMSGGATLATVRFPVSVLLILAFSLICNLETAGLLQDDAAFVRMSAALSGAIAISITVVLALEGRRRGNWFVTAAGSALAAAATGLAIQTAEPFAIYAPALIVASVLSVPLVPSFGRGTSRDFWTFTLWSTVGVVLAFMSVVLFVLGVFAILEMVRYLFQTAVFQRFDRYLLTTAFTLVGPLFALGRIPRADGQHTSFDPEDRLVRTVRPLFDWVLAPLVLVSALVLHAYVGRILVTGDVPRGQIGWIVGTYVLLVLGLRLAIDPFEEGTGWAARIFRRSWIAILVLPLGLLAYALGLRVSAEGVTAERYYLGLWGLAVALVVCAQVVPRLRGDTRTMTAIPVALLAASTFGPWGVADVVGRSQAARIQQAFGPFLQRSAPGRSELPNDARPVLRSRLYALDEVGELWRVRSMLDADRAADSLWRDRNSGVSALVALLQLDRDRSPPQTAKRFRGETNEPLDASGFDLVFTSRTVETTEVSTGGRLGLRFEGNDLIVAFDQISDTLDFAMTAAKLPQTGDGDAVTRTPALVADVTTRSGRHVRLRVETAVLDPYGRVSSAEITLLLRSQEWMSAPGALTLPPAPPAGSPPATR